MSEGWKATIAAIGATAAILFGVFQMVEGLRRDLTAEIRAVNQRIDAVLLAERTQ